MYKVKTKIQNIEFPYVNRGRNHIVYFHFKTNKMSLDDVILICDFPVFGVSFLDESRLVINSEQKIFVYDIEKKQGYWKNQFGSFRIKEEGICLVSKDWKYIDNKEINNWIIFDYIKNKEIKSFSFGKEGLYPHYFYEDRIVFQEKTYLIKCLSETGTEWTNDISDIGIWRRRGHGVTYREEYAIRRAIAVVNDVLWLDISKGVIMGIDARTGKTLHVFKEQEAEIIKIEGKNSVTKEYNFYQETELSEHPQTFYDEATQKLFGVQNHQYYEIDLQNPKLKIWDLIDEYAQFDEIVPFRDGMSVVRLQAWSTRSCFDTAHIYFIVDNPSKAQIVALNRQTLKIDWFYEFDDSGILMQIEVSSNNLYVLDNQSTLHIFEKEV